MTDLVEVRLLDVSLAAYRRTSEHQDELLREFALITEGRREEAPVSGPADVPARLLAVIEDLTARFAAFTSDTTAALRRALDRGDEQVDLVYRVPPEVGPAAEQFDRLLDETDEYCRAGDLLTLAAPADVAAFRKWFLEQFVAQAAGAPPTPWPVRYSETAPG